MEQNLKRLRVRRHHDKLREAAVQRLGGLVGALFQLFVVGSLLHQVEDLGGESSVRQGVGLGVDLGFGLWGGEGRGIICLKVRQGRIVTNGVTKQN